MEQFATEEQQVEAIKKFWKDNGLAIVAGVVLGLGGLYGWRWYNDSQIQAKEQASKTYSEVVASLATDDVAAAQKFVEESDSGYALLTALRLAKIAVDNGDLAEAEKQLSIVSQNTQSATLASLASLRLARVKAQLNDVEGALTSLNSVTEEAYAAQVEDIKGDIYAAQKQFDKAKAAYEASLQEDSENQLVKMKLDNLGAVSNG